MLNKVILIGRLVKDVEMKTVGEGEGINVANFTLAVDKRFRSRTEGAQTADFIPVCAWRKTAEFAQQYFHKGKQVFVAGRLETYSYNGNDGTKKYSFRVNAEEIGFADSVRSSENDGQGGIPDGNVNPDDFGFIDNNTDFGDDDLPF